MTRIICGPSGGIGGTDFIDDVPSRTTPGLVRIRSGSLINSVQFEYVDADGVVIESEAHGGFGGTARTIPLGENAAIIGITGRYGTFVDSLFITTAVRDQTGAFQKSKTVKFGGNGGAADFAYQAPAGHEIVGFFGRSGKGVDAIGVLFRPLAERGLSTSIVEVREPVGVGGRPLEPGGGGGQPLDDDGNASESSRGTIGPPGRSVGETGDRGVPLELDDLGR